MRFSTLSHAHPARKLPRWNILDSRQGHMQASQPSGMCSSPRPVRLPTATRLEPLSLRQSARVTEMEARPGPKSRSRCIMKQQTVKMTLCLLLCLYQRLKQQWQMRGLGSLLAAGAPEPNTVLHFFRSQLVIAVTLDIRSIHDPGELREKRATAQSDQSSQ